MTAEFLLKQNAREGWERGKELLESNIKVYEDWPREGTSFRDVSPLLANPRAFQIALNRMVELVGALKTEKGVYLDTVVGLEARGFLFAVPLAYCLKKPFLMMRKRGKLPGVCRSKKIASEYGETELSVNKESVRPGQRILLVGDVLATGGTAEAAMSLITELGGRVMGCVVLLELLSLRGRERLISLPIESVLTI